VRSSDRWQIIGESLRWRNAFAVFLLIIREALRPIFYWYAWHVFETDLLKPVARPYAKDHLATKIYSAHDKPVASRQEIAATSQLAPAEIDKRLARGDRVVVAFLNGRPAGCMWMTFASRADLVFDTIWMIRQGEAMKYGSFVLPEFRGRGIHSLLNYMTNSHLRSVGVTRVLSCVSILNPQSMSLPKHDKRSPAMTIFVGRLRGLNWTVRKAWHAPLESRFSWVHPTPLAGYLDRLRRLILPSSRP
jgi:GNAT superfamily N-acetyltransferase